MAQQGTEEKTGSSGDEDSGQGTPADESTGRHAASGESTSTEQSSGSDQKAESTQAGPEQSAQKSEQPTEKHETQPSEKPTEKAGSAPQRGQADTSWAEPEREPSGSSRHRSVDVGELVWRTGNVIATVVRTLALLFTLVLVVNVVLVLVGVNPANGVAQFVGGVADIVILGFRNLFIPANPMLMLIVNSLVAAVFWVFVGELASRLIRFLAARVK